MSSTENEPDCRELQRDILDQRKLIIVSNRGPCSFQMGEDGEVKAQRSGGGLVTALLALARKVPSTWVATAMTDEDRSWREGEIPLGEEEDRAWEEVLKKHKDPPKTSRQDEKNTGENLYVRFIAPETDAYHAYYQVISNPLLWFLQHSIWDFSRTPTLNLETWRAWEAGYVKVNQLFADAVVEQVMADKNGASQEQPALIMLQDYHLYLAPRMIRRRLRSLRKVSSNLHQSAILTHFIHIPWPGPEDWGLLPGRMREAILEGLCACDLVGFQTKEDALNFIRTCESLLPGARVNYRSGRVTLRTHATHVRDFPISIDVDALHASMATEEVEQYAKQLEEVVGERKVILRIDRTEPSKNIVRGFQAFEELLETHPEHEGKVIFLTLLVPSRLEVEEYQDYLNAIMATAGRINARFGSSEWEPVRVLVGESYPRALAAMKLYDVLLVNPVADGMNLVAKEGPTVNENCGVMVLSERAGAHQQLGQHALVIAPVDVSATADALHRALVMPMDERRRRATELKRSVEAEDIYLWLCWQLDTLQELINQPVETKKVVSS